MKVIRTTGTVQGSKGHTSVLSLSKELCDNLEITKGQRYDIEGFEDVNEDSKRRIVVLTLSEVDTKVKT